MVEPLAAASPLESAWPCALPRPRAALKVQVQVQSGLRVLLLRHLAGGTVVLQTALQSALQTALQTPLPAHDLAAPWPEPGSCHGADPWLIWSRPTEVLLLTTHHAVAEGLLQALRPGREPLACAVDASSGCAVFELLGAGVAELLPHLFDASAIPPHAGRATRARLMDISVTVIRLAPERAWLVVDRTHGLYAAQWLGYGSLP